MSNGNPYANFADPPVTALNAEGLSSLERAIQDQEAAGMPTAAELAEAERLLAEADQREAEQIAERQQVARVLATGGSLPAYPVSETADPLLLDCLQLLERLTTGGLIAPAAYDAFDKAAGLVARLRLAVAPNQKVA